MADFAVIGALALDRPVRLSGPLGSGARVAGTTLGGALEGRLGGGGANAGVALARAGHTVSVAAMIADDADGDAVLAMARAAGLAVGGVQRRPGASRTTLILVEPSGERTVLGLDFERPAVLSDLPRPDGRDFDGAYVRAPYPGAGAWAAASRGPVVAHWPCVGFEGPCDVLVASADDCDAATLADPFAAARAAVGERLAWFVMTHGAGAVVAHGRARRVEVAPAPVAVVDSTGAGDVFAAGLLEALAAGATMEEALPHACAWGAVAVGLDSSAPLAGHFVGFRRG